MKHLLSQTRQGELIIAGESVLWGAFPVIAILSFSQIAPPFAAAWSTLFSALFFIILVTVQKKWGDAKKLDAWKDILLSALIIGILFYALLFWGLTKTTSGNASIVGLMEIFFSFFFFEFLFKEKSPRSHIYGAILMIIGAMMVISHGELRFHSGDFLVLLAAAIAPIGNHFQRKARKKVSSGFLMLVRSGIGAVFLFVFAFLTCPLPEITVLFEALPFLFLSGTILLGFSKILWLEGIHRISVPKACTINSISPIFTLIFAYFLLGEIPTIWQIAGFVPIFVGILFVTRTHKKTSSSLDF